MTIAAVTSWAPTCLAAGAFGALGWGDVAVIVAAIGVMMVRTGVMAYLGTVGQ